MQADTERPTCSICTKPRRARGYCKSHYMALYQSGALTPLPQLSPEERFWAKVNKDGPVPEFRPDLGACWLWTGSLNRDGYGRPWRDGRCVYAHRWGYETFVAPVARGTELDHLCRVRACVRFSHLEPVTRKENARRGVYGLRTHCPRGHEYDEANTYITKSGWRDCRACHRDDERVRRTHRQQAGRLLRLIAEHEAEISPDGLALFQRCAFAFYIDGRDA